ncbi:tetratricopeptide repeat protein [Spirosoma arcticum]
MKAIILMLLCCSLFIDGYAQQAQGTANTLDAAMAESMKKDKEKSDKDITDGKASTKASTWMDRAKTYQNIAIQNIKLDSNAAMVAMEAYNKVVELDKDKKGGPGKLAKEATETLKSKDMYNAIMQQGVAKFQSKNYPEAVKLMSMAGDILPQDTLAPLYTAIGAQQIKDNATAKTQLEKYVTNGGKDASIYGSLAMLYRNDKEIDKALAALDKGIAMAPTNKDLSNERINIMLASNRMDEAISGMKQLVDKEPNNVQNIVNLAILYDNGASKMGEEIRKLGGDAKQGNNSAKKLAAEKDALSAITGEVARLNAAIKKKPTPELKRQLAEVQNRQKAATASVAQLETQAKEAASTAGAAGENATKVADLQKKQTEQRDLAKQYYTKALAVDPANYDANYNMGVFFFNDAVEMKKAVDNMDMAEYNKRGKEVDGQVCGKFKQALPYFTKAKSVKEEADLTENLTNLQNILKQYEERKVVCVESN